MKSPKSIFVLILCACMGYSIQSATCMALASGDWGNAANWSCGAVPNCGDSIVIPAGTSVSITTNFNYGGCAQRMEIAVKGTLVFVNGKKVDLPCNSNVYIYAGGLVTSSGGGGSNNEITVCGQVYWTADMGPLDGPSCFPAGTFCSKFLPIELSSFSATVNAGTIDLYWTTASEKNNQYFEIESSADALNFGKIASIDSKAPGGNSVVKLDYKYSCTPSANDLNYYRLKQVDKDKTFTYSSVISVNIPKEKNIKFAVYPNTNQDEFTADISGIENNQKVTILLTDQRGEQVYRSDFITGENNARFNIAPGVKLSNGVYICTMQAGEISFHIRVVII
jgi:hypothetical protein